MKLRNKLQPSTRVHLTLLLPLLTGLLLGGCRRAGFESESRNPAAAQPLAVQVIRVRRGDVARQVVLPGAVVAYQQALLCAKVPGYLKSIRVDKGDPVKEGDLLAEIEAPELLAEQSRFKAEAQVAAIDYDRVKAAQSKAPDLVMPQSVDNALARLDVAKANLERNTTLLNYTRIVAPFSGVITRRFVDPGAYIPAATSANSAQNAGIVTVVDASKVRVQVAIPETEVPWVNNGVPVRVQLEEMRNRSFDGTVTRYAHALDEATRTMLAEIELPNADGALLPGMYASVHIAIQKKTNALIVPVDAVLVEKNKASVFVPVDNRAKKVPVKTGFTDGVSVELTEGVQMDQPIILVGKQSLNDGQEIVSKETP